MLLRDMKRFAGAWGVCLLALRFAEVSAVAEGHVWFQWVAGARSSGRGTLENPYVVGFARDFDLRLNRQPSGAVLHLLPGTFETFGRCHPNPDGSCSSGWLLKSGQRLVGSGMTNTVLKLVGLSAQRPNNPRPTHVVRSVPRAAGCVVSDLTIDCNYERVANPQRLAFRHVGGVVLFGTEHTIERVRVIGAGNDDTRLRECFILSIFGNDAAQGITPSRWSRGNLIRGCVVSGFTGRPGVSQGATAIALNSGSDPVTQATIAGLIEGNTVELPLASTNYYLNCIGTAGASNVVVRGNRTEGGTMGLYSDTGMIRSLTVRDNRFLNAQVGVGFNWDGIDDGITAMENIYILTNHITLHSLNSQVPRFGIWNHKVGSHTTTRVCRNWVIAGNTISYSDQYSPNSRYRSRSLEIYGVSDLSIFGNVLASDSDNRAFGKPMVPTQGAIPVRNTRREGNNTSLRGRAVPLLNLPE